MAARELPSVEKVRQLFRYDPETGRIFWRKRTVDHFDYAPPETRETLCKRFNRRFEDKEAGGTHHAFGYRMVKWTIGPGEHRAFSAHRLAWCLFHGEWPSHEVDHIDGDPANNQISNLRDVPQRINARNRRTGLGELPLGVRPSSNGKRWKAVYWDNGPRYIGSYDTMDLAAEAAKAKRLELGYSERHCAGEE